MLHRKSELSRLNFQCIVTALILFSFPSNAYTQQLAFPGAEGWGRFTSGGRGGRVIEVTNLKDSGPGSLREAINTSGARTIVFKVSGTIFLKSPLSIKNGDLTIAGQTAPGDGICISGYTTSINADNLIVRYVRFRLGDINGVEDDAFNGTDHKNIIIDHCSITWGTDECASFYDNENFTMQWCIIGEGLYNSTGSKRTNGYGGIQGGKHATFHHNLYIHNASRNPRLCGARYHTATASTEIVDFVNNVIYNWGFNTVYGGEEGRQNVRANYYKAGPATSSETADRILNPIQEPGRASYGRFYVADNYVDGFPAATLDNWGVGVQGSELEDTIKSQIRVDRPFPGSKVAIQTPAIAYNLVLKNAGAILPKRDVVDLRYIEETRAGMAVYEGATYKLKHSVPDSSRICGIIDSQNDVGGWPQLNMGPIPYDTDHDGMPDYWETANDLNPEDPEDRNAIGQDGYTNLEKYLNSK